MAATAITAVPFRTERHCFCFPQGKLRDGMSRFKPRQPLDNLRNAGLIYGQIIYNKAPVMMIKLVELMGEDKFREGIREYLNTYAYSNATWNDLIRILDNKTAEDLAAFSDVWVNQKGMPTTMPFPSTTSRADCMRTSETSPLLPTFPKPKWRCPAWPTAAQPSRLPMPSFCRRSGCG